MSSSMDIWFGGNKELIWDKFCGYLHFSLPAFMHIQEKLLMEQIELLQKCDLGRKFLGDGKINSVEEFRRKVPITTYEDYEPYLSKKREDLLPARPKTWTITTGIGGQPKWVPISEKAWDVLLDSLLSLYIMSTSRREANFSLKPGDVMFNISPPRPFFAAIGVRDFTPLMGLKLIPPDSDEFNNLSFFERISRGFQMALHDGIHIIAGIGSMIANVGKSFSFPFISRSFSLNPKLESKIVNNWIKYNFCKKDVFPKDIWKLKGILATGSDLSAFERKIEYCWGVKPFEFYVNTECVCNIGSLAWNRKSMTFSPYAGLLEFLPWEGIEIMSKYKDYFPKTMLLNQIETEKLYELVFTNFNGGIFSRYRTGDLIKFIALKDEKENIKLPQFIVSGRADKLIDIGNFTRIDEKTIWRALENTNTKYNSWMARKEIERTQPILKVYLDCSDNENEIALSDLLHNKLKDIDNSYKNLEVLAGIKPLRIKLLPSGTLSRWESEMIKAGRNMGWIVEQRMQAPDEVIEELLKMAKDNLKE